MKKLIALILILVLALPAASCADGFYVAYHYSMHIETCSPENSFIQSSRIFDFDSKTIDLYLDQNKEQGYIVESTCYGGRLLFTGPFEAEIRNAGGLCLMFNLGTRYPVEFDESSGDLFLDFGSGLIRMHLVETFNIYEDRK